MSNCIRTLEITLQWFHVNMDITVACAVGCVWRHSLRSLRSPRVRYEVISLLISRMRESSSIEALLPNPVCAVCAPASGRVFVCACAFLHALISVLDCLRAHGVCLLQFCDVIGTAAAAAAAAAPLFAGSLGICLMLMGFSLTWAAATLRVAHAPLLMVLSMCLC